MKNKIFVFINVFGLAIAMACCIVAYLCYDFNAGFDHIHKKASTVYRVSSWREFQHQKTKYGHVPMGLGNVVAQNINDIENVIRYSPGDGNFRINQDLVNIGIKFVDTAFFQTFTFNFIQGNGSLTDQNNLVISEGLARRFFGNEFALGKSIEQLLGNGGTKTFTISGVFSDPPNNSSFSGEAYSNFYNHRVNESDWNENSWSYRVALFVTLSDPSRLLSINSQLKKYTEYNNKVRQDFIISDFELEPFLEMDKEVRNSYTRSSFPSLLIVIVSAISVFILIITCLNMTNSSIAISSRRLIEIGIRKVMGSRKKDMVLQFMGETLLICSIAMAVGFLLAHYILIPSFNDLWPNLKLDPKSIDEPNFLIFSLLTVLVTTIMAGSYPAFYISKFLPTVILNGRLMFGGNTLVTFSLLAIQFTISMMALICSLAFIDNARFQQDFDLGFDKNGLLFTELANRSEVEIYKNALNSNPDIISIADSRHHISARTYFRPVKSGTKEMEVEIMDVGSGYLKTAGLKLLEGRDFVNDSETDRKESVIITEETARKFGWTEPIGNEITLMDTMKLSVIGVVKNIYNNGFWKNIDSMIIRYGEQDASYYIIASTSPSKVQEINKFMEEKWKELFPDKLFEGHTMDNSLYEANRVNNNILKMSGFLGIVTFMLSVTSLFTLLSLNINRRMKEIGVRKVLGASMANLSWVLNKEFLSTLLVACVVGILLGEFLVDDLLSELWMYHQEVTLLTLSSSLVVQLTGSVLSIGYKVYKITSLNPSDVLRDE